MVQDLYSAQKSHLHSSLLQFLPNSKQFKMPPFRIQEGVPSDLEEMVAIWCEAMERDVFWRTMMQDMSEDQVRQFVNDNVAQRMVIGPSLGASKTFKIVDETNGFVSPNLEYDSSLCPVLVMDSIYDSGELQQIANIQRQ